MFTLLGIAQTCNIDVIIFVAQQPSDMRAGVNKLCGEVRSVGLDMGTSYYGSTPFSDEMQDNRFRAPETVNGLYNHLTDIYDLGIVMTMMLCGVLDAEHSPEGFDRIDPLKYHNSFMDKSRKFLSASLRLILERATDVNLKSRFQNVDKFQYFLNKLAKGKISTQTHVERPTSDTSKSKKHEDETDEYWFARLAREAIQSAHQDI